MRNFGIINLLLLILGIVYISGCVPARPEEEEEIASADRLIKRLEASNRKVKTFNGSGVIEVSSFSNYKSTFEVSIKKPDSLRISAFGPFGITLGEGLITNSDFLFYNSLENTAYKGKTDSIAVKGIFKINFPYQDIVYLFSGVMDFSSKLTQQPDEFSFTKDEYLLVYNEPGKKSVSEYYIDRASFTLKRYLMKNPDGLTIIESKYSKYQKYDNVQLPTEISFYYKMPGKEQKVKISYRNIKLNREIKSLQLDLPSGTYIKKVE